MAFLWLHDCKNLLFKILCCCFSCFSIINACLNPAKSQTKNSGCERILRTLSYHATLFRCVTRLSQFYIIRSRYSFQNEINSLAILLSRHLIDHAQSNSQESRERFSYEFQDMCNHSVFCIGNNIDKCTSFIDEKLYM